MCATTTRSSFLLGPLGLFGGITLLTLLGSACAERGVPGAPESARVVESSDEPSIDSDRISTPGDLALSNLSSQVAGRLAALERRPNDHALRGHVIGLLLSRAHYAGSYGDLDAAELLAEDGVRRAPSRREAYEQRAGVLSALHRFDEADDDLASAEELAGPGVDPERYVARRAVHAVAVGARLDDVHVWASARADAYPSYESLSLLASIEAAMGRFAEADDHWVESLAHYRDVSPFPLAFVAFQRGVMWAEMANQPERAVPLYREAVRRLPGYVVANVHLAELEATLLGAPDQAIDRLARLVGETTSPSVGDPEPLGLLGEVLTASGQRAEAAIVVGQAQRMYEELLDAHPEAFADHGAEFFAGPGEDPARAVDLALGNLALRSNARAFIVLIEAAIAAGDSAMVCMAVRRATMLRYATPVLDARIAENEARCD